MKNNTIPVLDNINTKEIVNGALQDLHSFERKLSAINTFGLLRQDVRLLARQIKQDFMSLSAEIEHERMAG